MVTATLAAGPAQAQPADAWSVNLAAVSDYRYRGISQTRLQPALQGGVDANRGPWYVGAWASSVKWVRDAGGQADRELDLYAGVKLQPTEDWLLDLGLLRYQYPGHALRPSPQTTEWYAALSHGVVTAKLSQSATNLFGFADSRGSQYLALAATFELAGLSITPHLGHQRVRRNASASYTDVALTVSKSLAGVQLYATALGTDSRAYTSPRNGQRMDKAGLLLGLKHSF